MRRCDSSLQCKRPYLLPVTTSLTMSLKAFQPALHNSCDHSCKPVISRRQAVLHPCSDEMPVLRLPHAPPHGSVGPGWSVVATRSGDLTNSSCHRNSRELRPGPLPRRAAAQVPHATAVHLPSVQRGAAHLPRAAVRVQRDVVHAHPPAAAGDRH